MELQIKSESKGIRYDGYDNDFIQCVYEEANVSGRNVRYEFRCRPDLECCDRKCCIPQKTTIPPWLTYLFIILGLLLLLAFFATLAYLYRKKKNRNMNLDDMKQTKIANQYKQRAPTSYHSCRRNEIQDGLSTERLIQRDKENTYSSPNDFNTQLSTHTNNNYRIPLCNNSNAKVATSCDPTKDDNNAYDKARTSNGARNGINEETTYQSELAAENTGRKQLNMLKVRSNEYQTPERLPPLPAMYNAPPQLQAPYSSCEKFEERFEEKFHVEEEKSKSGSETKELL